MNFHVFVLIVTIVFYIILRFYKHTVENERRNGKPKSNFIYVLFVPVTLYLTRFMYISTNTNINTNTNTNTGGAGVGGAGGAGGAGVGGGTIAGIPSESLLSMPFPESSISISSTVD